MANPLIYMIRADIAEDYVDQHHDWYARRHAPDLMAAGFWAARGYDSATSPNMWNIYEVPDVAIFSSEAYTGGHKADPFLETAVKKLSGRTVSLYTQVLAVDAAGRDMPLIPTLQGKVVLSLRFNSQAGADAIKKWFRETVVAKHLNAAGLGTVRLWGQRDQHPKWPSIEPVWSVGVEWDSEQAAERANARKLLEGAIATGGINASDVKYDLVKKRYALVREDILEDRLASA